MVKPLNENSREIDMTTKTSFGYVLLKKAYTHVLGVDNNTNDQIEHCEEIIRQKGAMGHLQAKLITQSDEEFLLDSNFFLHFDYNECSDESESWALVSDVFGSPASVKTGYLYIKVDDLQKNKDGFIKELNKGRALISIKLDLSNPKIRKFHDILTSIEYVMNLPVLRDKTEMACFDEVSKNHVSDYKISAIKNIWNGNYPNSRDLGFTKEYIEENYCKE